MMMDGWWHPHFNSVYLRLNSFVIAASSSVLHINIQLSSASLTPTIYAWNLGLMIDDHLTFTQLVASVIQSFGVAPHNIRKIKSSLWWNKSPNSQTLVKGGIWYLMCTLHYVTISICQTNKCKCNETLYNLYPDPDRWSWWQWRRCFF